jgi:DNA-directed RNA polymerase sigma subunit (sigma70/sigma32)
MQAGVAGLLCALGRYDARLGTPFWAYSSWWVRRAMEQRVRERVGPVG